METSTQLEEIAKALGTMFGCVLFLFVPVCLVFFVVMACTRKTRGWVVGSVICGVIVILAIGGVIVSEFMPGHQAPEENTRYASMFPTRDGLAEIMGAPGWKEIELGSEEASLMLGSTDAEEYLMVFSEANTDMPEGFTLDEFAELSSNAILSAATNPIATELSPLEIGGLAALSHEVSGTVSGIEVIYYNTFVQGKTHYHQIISWTLPKFKSQGLPRLKTAARSFREISPAHPSAVEPNLIPQ
jgi:hypothetical protein